MTRARYALIGAGALALLAWSSRPESGRVALAAQGGRPPRIAYEYRAMTRVALENSTPPDPDEAKNIRDVIEGMSTPRLERGLNALGAEGWELVAVEPYHERAPQGISRGVTICHDPTYLFKRTK